MAAGGALVLSGGGIWVGSCAVGCVLAVGGSFALVSDRPGTLGVEIGRETPNFIGRSLPFSPAGGPGVGGGWSTDGWFCALGGGLQCGTHLQRLTSHREALGIADGGELSIFSLKIAGDPPSALSGSFCGGARVSPNGSL